MEEEEPKPDVEEEDTYLEAEEEGVEDAVP